MALFTSFSTAPLSASLSIHHPPRNCKRFHPSFASLSSSSPESSQSETTVSSTPSPKPIVESSRPPSSGLHYAIANPNGNLIARFVRSTEYNIERIIFDFRFLALLAVGGSLAGSLLCFLNIIGKGLALRAAGHSVLGSSGYWETRVEEEVIQMPLSMLDVYLAGTVMLIFGMGLYGLFISNVSPDVPPSSDRALKGSSLFGMFALQERPKWMKISSLDELKTKVGHVIVMILLVKMFERSKMVKIITGTDLLSYSVCIFLSSASLYILHNLHKSE
ncbi:hypothetical protein L1049_011305 [Liquidambar formosana]|uniref:Uncharacterized protein n=1 Tax=Liquidambar formosana TaxID=63359 RepID=A0AAP0WZP3_LIQFO